MNFSIDRAFRSLLLALVDVRLGGPDSIPEYQRYGKFGSVQGQIRALCDLGVITWDQHVLLTDLLLNASAHAGEPFIGECNVGPVMPSYIACTRHQSPVKPLAQVPVNERQVPAPTARPGLRLLCLLVQTRNGETRSLPVHTLRPMPPRLCAADSHAANGLRRWNLEASGLGVDSGAGLCLREAHAARPPREVVERCLPRFNLGAERAISVLAEAPTEAEQVQGRAPGLSEHASPFGQTEARAKRTLDPVRTETASARECGAASPPRAPEPSAARVG